MALALCSSLLCVAREVSALFSRDVLTTKPGLQHQFYAFRVEAEHFAQVTSVDVGS